MLGSLNNNLIISMNDGFCINLIFKNVRDLKNVCTSYKDDYPPSILIFTVNPSLRPYNTICIQNMLFYCVLYHDSIQNDIVGTYTQPNLT